MSDYSTIQQHEPLRTPDGWSASEKRFIAQLEEIFDDIYRRFGRLRVKDMGSEVKNILTTATETDGRVTTLESTVEQTAESIRTEVSKVETKADDAATAASNAQTTADEAKSTITQTASDIRLEVSQVETKADNAQTTADNIANGTTAVQKVQNSSVAIDADGIALSGGNIIVQAGAKIVVQSGGAVQMDAKDGENSYITLGDMFSATADGGVVSDSASFSELKVGGMDVLTKSDLSTKIIVATNQPSETNVLWFKPSSISSIDALFFTGSDRNMWFSEGHPSNTVTVTKQTADTLEGSTFTYTISVPLTLVTSGSEPSLVMHASAYLASDTSNYVAFSGSVPALTVWKEVTVTLTATSTINLAATTDDIQLQITLYGMQTINTYIQKERNITLNIKTEATSSCMPCSVYYLP